VCNTCNPKIFTSIVEEFWSRRSLLKGAVAVPLAATLIPRAAFGQAQTLQSVEDSAAAQGLKSPLPATIYVAKRIITMERAAPTATAVAVEGDKIAAVGELDGVKEAVAGRQITIDDRFAGKVIMPGFIEHHIHPLLGAMTMSAEVIAIEDWAIPGRYSKAATSNEEYVARLNQALAALAGKPRDETLFTWGYHQYFHGLIRRPQLDEISPNRPMVVWHRSAHEFILNTAALNKYGVTEQSLKGTWVGERAMQLRRWSLLRKRNRADRTGLRQGPDDARAVEGRSQYSQGLSAFKWRDDHRRARRPRHPTDLSVLRRAAERG